jgi:hypothetical protein
MDDAALPSDPANPTFRIAKMTDVVPLSFTSLIKCVGLKRHGWKQAALTLKNLPFEIFLQLVKS